MNIDSHPGTEKLPNPYFGSVNLGMDFLPVISELPRIVDNNDGEDLTHGAGKEDAKILRPNVDNQSPDYANIVVKHNEKVAFSCPSNPYSGQANNKFKNYLLDKGLSIKGLAAT